MTIQKFLVYTSLVVDSGIELLDAPALLARYRVLLPRVVRSRIDCLGLKTFSQLDEFLAVLFSAGRRCFLLLDGLVKQMVRADHDPPVGHGVVAASLQLALLLDVLAKLVHVRGHLGTLAGLRGLVGTLLDEGKFVRRVVLFGFYLVLPKGRTVKALVLGTCFHLLVGEGC